ncbi:hypothetical protein MLD38_024465 [Melastoma candidum]|uniref:Uncharacterized protein n=1 Tax=Melastoma candidum TaxID=119954 RepID=A0ACB9NXF2_9MYRT|nr:hypothetical protein MLD38_024465 [Melastoma candidum]
MAKSGSSKQRLRPIVRLGIILISRSFVVSVFCCAAGVVALLLLPILANNTYVSENALMPGSANSMLSNQDVADAYKLVKELGDLRLKSNNVDVESQRLVARYISELGADVNYHEFNPGLTKFSPLKFFSSPDFGISQDDNNCSANGVNIIGIVRAPQGDGKESIVLVTPYDSSNARFTDYLSLGIAYSVFSLLSQVTWLAKDVVWLVADSRYGEYSSVSSWLQDYHAPVFYSRGTGHSSLCNDTLLLHGGTKNNAIMDKWCSSDGLRRGGTMSAAFVLKVADDSEPFQDTLKIYAEASNGQMPNLDLVNIVNYLAIHRQGLHVEVRKFFSLSDAKWLEFLGKVFEWVGMVARTLNPQWKFGIPTADYVDGTATLASSLYHQALGIPTGSHGAFRDYQVDAVTLEFSLTRYSMNRGSKDFIMRGGRLIEGVVRSVNNLLEKFHHSFFLYLLTSPGKFVSVGIYMIPFALLVAPLPVVAAALYTEANNSATSTEGDQLSSQNAWENDYTISKTSWTWLKAAKEVMIVHLWAAAVTLFPYYICEIPNWSPVGRLALWGLLSTAFLGLFFWLLGSPSASNRTGKEYVALLKSVTISAAFIGLDLMSVVNFATAEFGALLLVPMCLMVQPIQLDLKVRRLRNLLRVGFNLVLGLLGFLPVTFYMIKGIFDDFDDLKLDDFWHWLESLWAWNSATYLFLGMVHLPCWLLCLRILFHS